jgi:hypothetical protein
MAATRKKWRGVFCIFLAQILPSAIFFVLRPKAARHRSLFDQSPPRSDERPSVSAAAGVVDAKSKVVSISHAAGSSRLAVGCAPPKEGDECIETQRTHLRSIEALRLKPFSPSPSLHPCKHQREGRGRSTIFLAQGAKPSVVGRGSGGGDAARRAEAVGLGQPPSPAPPWF